MKNDIRSIKVIKGLFIVAALAIFIVSIVLVAKEILHFSILLIQAVSMIPTFVLLQILQNAASRIEALSIALYKKTTITEKEINGLQDKMDDLLKEQEKEEQKKQVKTCPECYYALNENGYCKNCGYTTPKQSATTSPNTKKTTDLK